MAKKGKTTGSKKTTKTSQYSRENTLEKNSEIFDSMSHPIVGSLVEYQKNLGETTVQFLENTVPARKTSKVYASVGFSTGSSLKGFFTK